MSELETFLGSGWDALEAAVADRTDPMRQIVVATATDRVPDARILVLRGVDRHSGTLEAHTDNASPKVAALMANPAALVLAWSPARQLQMRISCSVEVKSGHVTEKTWAKVPEASRLGYGGPQPGSQIKEPTARGPADATRFAILEAHVRSIDILTLGPDLHCRAIFDATDNFRGTWVAP